MEPNDLDNKTKLEIGSIEVEIDNLGINTKEKIDKIDLESREEYNKIYTSYKKMQKNLLYVFLVLIICIIILTVYSINKAKEGELIDPFPFLIMFGVAIIIASIEESYRWKLGKVKINALDAKIKELLESQKMTGNKIKIKFPKYLYILLVFMIAILLMLVYQSYQKYLGGNPTDLYAVISGLGVFAFIFCYVIIKYRRLRENY